jgi:hypothetical protein
VRAAIIMVVPLLAVALACDAAPKKKRRATDTTQPLERSCSVQECFTEREVRDFEVIDQTTVIVYVGSERCAFLVELRGTFCDLTFAPELYFRSPHDFERGDAQRDVFGLGSPIGGRLGDLRVCSNDIDISVDGGVFTENPQSNQPPDRFGNRRSECQISSVASITDDDLLQLYVDHGVAPPPPPMGSGKIEVGEQKNDEDPEQQPAARETREAGAEATADTAGN